MNDGAAAIVAPAVTSAAFSRVEKIPRDWRRRIAASILITPFTSVSSGSA